MENNLGYLAVKEYLLLSVYMFAISIGQLLSKIMAKNNTMRFIEFGLAGSFHNPHSFPLLRPQTTSPMSSSYCGETPLTFIPFSFLPCLSFSEQSLSPSQRPNKFSWLGCLDALKNIRDHVHMTSARRGEGGFKNCPILRTDKTDRLREMRTMGKGGLKSRKFCGRYMYMDP